MRFTLYQVLRGAGGDVLPHAGGKFLGVQRGLPGTLPLEREPGPSGTGRTLPALLRFRSDHRDSGEVIIFIVLFRGEREERGFKTREEAGGEQRCVCLGGGRGKGSSFVALLLRRI